MISISQNKHHSLQTWLTGTLLEPWCRVKKKEALNILRGTVEELPSIFYTKVLSEWLGSVEFLLIYLIVVFEGHSVFWEMEFKHLLEIYLDIRFTQISDQEP